MAEPIQMQGGNVHNRLHSSQGMAAPQVKMASPFTEPPVDVASKLGLAPTTEVSRKTLTAEDLLSDSDVAQEVELEGLGLIKIKPLSMGTSMTIQKAAKGDMSKQSIWMIQQSLVEPKLTPEQINKISVGKMSKIVEAINKVSGLDNHDENVIENF